MRSRYLFKTLALVAAVMCSFSAAAQEAYANYTSSNTTLTFYYDNLRSTRTGTTYDLNTGNTDPGWRTDNTCQSVTMVVFNSSFASARPTSTYRWFSKMSKLTSITGLNYFNTSEVTNMASMFYGCTRLTSLTLTGFNTAKVTNMGFMFQNCSGLTSLDVSNFNTANVTTMSYMFDNCSSLTSLDLSSFNTSQVTNMNSVFERCSSLITIYVGSRWSTNAVTSTGSVFSGCTSLVGGMGTAYDANHTDKTYAHIDGGPSNPGYFTEEQESPYACYTSDNTTLTFYYDNQRRTRTGATYSMNTGTNMPDWYSIHDSVTSVVFDPSFADARPTSTNGWFYNMHNLQSISGFVYLNTSEMTVMADMFVACWALTSLDLSHFDTSNVTDMHGMFNYCNHLTSLDLSSFNTSRVTDMSMMFGDCQSLASLDLSNFDTSNVTDMWAMFYRCWALTSLDLSNFNTAKVTQMKQMFDLCYELKSLDLSSFNTAQVRFMNEMFQSCYELKSLDLSNFNTSQVISMNEMFSGCMFLKTIYVGTEWSTDAVTDSDLMFNNCHSLVGGMGTAYDANHTDKAYAHIDGGPSNPGYFTEWKEAYACFTPDDSTLTFYYDGQRSGRPGTTYDLNTETNIPDWYSIRRSVTSVEFDPSFADARPTSAYGWFYNMVHLQSISGFEYLNTSEVTDMGHMFVGCVSLTSLDLSHFDTSNVTDMFGMFNWCTGLTSLDVSSFNTSRVTSMSCMFDECQSLTTLDLSHFDTSNVTDMWSMFSRCLALTSLDVSNFNTAKVTDMSEMFKECRELRSLDLSSFNTSQVRSMNQMFSGCNLLNTIYVGAGWTTDAVTNSDLMFSSCYSLVGGMGTTYDANHKDKAYAHIDGGPSNPGYFTAKFIRGDVDGDGNVNIADVTALIDILLSGSTPPAGADCDVDGSVNIADVTALIDYLLSGHWS